MYRNPNALRFTLLMVALWLLGGCANVDRGLMQVSNAISSPDPVTGSREINLMSEQAEVAQGMQAAQKLLQEVRTKRLSYDGQLPEYGRVQSVFNRLRRVVHRQNLPWEVHLVDDKTWNAFTVGGGKVFVFQGLMQGDAAIQGDHELAVVLAHEMAHNTARHIGEREGKSLLTQLADKDTRSSLYQASWSSNQEHEADKFSVIYMALAGYDPMAAVNVWARVAREQGSYSADMLHSHPLSHERAQALQGYAQQARQYYIAGQINPQAAQILRCNVIFCNQRAGQTSPGGDGSGTMALLETLANTYVETENAKAEADRREQLKRQQVQQASQRLRLSNVRLVRNNQGQPGAAGTAENLGNVPIQGGVVRVQYFLQGKLVHQHSIKWPPMKARDRQPFTVPLKAGQFDSVKMIPEWVQ